MNDSTRHRRRLWAAPVLFVVLAITTGWGQSASTAPTPSAFGSSRTTDDVAQTALQSATVGADRQLRQQHPQRTFAAAVTTSNAPIVVESAPRSFSGRNHFWIPSLGVSRDVYAFGCARKRAPSNVIYRWGCGGQNNVYIFGHAYGVMRALHDAYVAGRLHVGMIAVYADGAGNIRTYRVTTWRLVSPSNSGWAVASQAVPSMTLQTCVGSRSQWRLIVCSR